MNQLTVPINVIFIKSFFSYSLAVVNSPKDVPFPDIEYLQMIKCKRMLNKMYDNDKGLSKYTTFYTSEIMSVL